MPSKNNKISLKERFINMLMLDGKKSTAQKILSDAFEIIKQAGNPDPEKVFDKAIENIRPHLEVKSKRVGGSNYQIPIEVKPERQVTLALRWTISISRGKKGQKMANKLAKELMEAAKGQGEAIKKKEDTHRMAEANKAFAHLAKYI